MDFILAFYLVSASSSLITNIHLTNDSYRKSIKNNKRKLKYRDKLNYRSKIILNGIKIEYIRDLAAKIIRSIIPIDNIRYTYDNVTLKYASYMLTKEIIDTLYYQAERKEDSVRKMNVEFINSLSDKLEELPNNTKENLNNKDFRLSDKEVKKILKLNKLNYDVEMSKYEKENNIKY